MTFTGTPPFTFTYTDGVTPVNVTAYPSNVYTASVSPLVTTTYTLYSPYRREQLYGSSLRIGSDNGEHTSGSDSYTDKSHLL